MTAMNWNQWLRSKFEEPNDESPRRFIIFRRNMMILIMVVTILPLLLMTAFNHYQYQKTLEVESVNPIRLFLEKTKHSLELFLAERQAAISFIASAYRFDELADQKTLSRIFQVMRREYSGFVDLGLINDAGYQVSYAGPYDLANKDYSEQNWFHEVRLRGSYVSDVFMGYRRFPHIAIAVTQTCNADRCPALRATISAEKLDNMIAAINIDPYGDTFLVNRQGVLQTVSRLYGPALEKMPIPVPPTSFSPAMIDAKDADGRDLVIGYTYVANSDFVLMVVQSKARLLRHWSTLKVDILVFFAVSVLVILVVTLKLTGAMIRRIQDSERKRESIYHEMQYTQKLASIGRLAAGVAHEINNPLAIINEKSGLMKDLIEAAPTFPMREKFLGLTASIIQSVDRCRTITHRLLGFARRMDLAIEVMDLNDVLQETVGLLEKEILLQNVRIEYHLAEEIPPIASDRGQLQQVFLNILNNAVAAVEAGCTISIRSWEENIEMVGVAIQDNGCGMSEETKKHIFEPFFSTKGSHGTGLGLSITYGIVKKLGGEIRVESEVGMGTTFTVIVPKKAKPSGE